MNVPLRTKLLISAVFVGLTVVPVVVLKKVGFERVSPKEECRSQCSSLGKSWRLDDIGPLPAKPIERETRCVCY